MNVNTLNRKLKEYVNSLVTLLSKDNPMIGLMKPLITRAIDKNVDKAYKFLDLIADNEGNIDVEAVLEEMILSLMNTKPFTFNTSIIGDIEIGEGLIKLNIPLTDKKLILNLDDINNLKSLLISK